jgi:hypothetical protein
MRLKRFRALVLALLTTGGTVLMAACDTATSVETQMPAVRSYDAVPATDGQEYTLVQGDLPEAEDSASAWIGRDGGMVVVAGGLKDGKPTMHGVYVREGTVNKPTLFTVKRLGGNQVGVRLDARTQSRNGTWTDVGGKGFRKPVYLFMTYAWATNVTDPSRLVILYDPEDGKAHEKTRSQVILDTNLFVTAELEHFSKYVMAVH